MMQLTHILVRKLYSILNIPSLSNTITYLVNNC